MKLIVQPEAREHIDTHGGTVYVWARAFAGWHTHTLVLESDTAPPKRECELVHASDGFQVFTPPGLVQPEELHLELSRRGKLRAYWNGQAWIG